MPVAPVIPRLRLSRDASKPPLFDFVPTVRHVRVLADADVVSMGMKADARTAPGLLSGLLNHESVDAWLYSDEGPSPDLPRVPSPFGRADAPLGWVVAVGVEDGSSSKVRGPAVTHEVGWMEGASYRLSTIYDGELFRATKRCSETVSASPSPKEGRIRARSDAVAVLSAERIGADLFVNERPYLHEVRPPLTDAVTLVTPAEALPLVSLFLRSQGVFLITKGRNEYYPYSFSVNRGLFYWVGTRELLHEAWRWYGACTMGDQAQGSDELTYLGMSVLRRVQRTLQYRDDLLRALNRRHDNDDADDAAAALDACLMSLMGAVDATARVAHRVLGLAGDIIWAGWQKNRWLETVSREARKLADVVAPTTPGSDALTILRLLRNSVHSCSLPPMGVSRMVGTREVREGTVVRVPREQIEDIQAAVGRLGGQKAWGMTETSPGDVHAEPGILLERLLPAILRLINELMAATPMEARLGYSHSPNLADAKEPFDEWTRTSIRLQLGISDIATVL